jgi:integration host factor alpha subunit
VWVQRYELGTAPVVFELDLDVLLQSVTPAYAELSRFPAVTRDLALVVDQQVAAGAARRLQAVAPAIVQRIELFDQYQGKGIEPNRKSLAFRVVMQETQRTLEDAEVDAAMNALTRHAEEALGAKLRVDAHEHDPYQGRACRLLFEQVGLNKREAKDMVECFFEEIRLALERGDCVKLSGFGNFQLREKPQRPGRNPKTGEEIPITARRVVTFHASQKLKANVEQLSDVAE